MRERNKWKKIFAYYNHCARCLNQGYRSGEIVAMILVLGARYWRHFEKYPALEEVWSPLLTSSKPILFCMGGMTVNALPSGSQLAQLQSGADENPSIQALADKFDVVPYSDVQVLGKFVSLAGAYGHAFLIQNSWTTVPSQLREGPFALIGAMNNDWTLNRISSLRFYIEGHEYPKPVYWIVDRLHPESRAWQVSAEAPYSNVAKDYAIAARFTDEGTGQVVLVAAGIGGSGTRAAGEFMTDEADLKQLADSAGADWRKKNFYHINRISDVACRGRSVPIDTLPSLTSSHCGEPRSSNCPASFNRAYCSGVGV